MYESKSGCKVGSSTSHSKQLALENNQKGVSFASWLGKGQVVWVRSTAVASRLQKKNWSERNEAFCRATVCTVLPKEEVRVVVCSRKKEAVIVKVADVLATEGSGHVRNMIELVNLNEATVLNNLVDRFNDRQAKIYTYAGPILLAVNPYEVLVDKNSTSIYASSYIDKYRNEANVVEQEPHIYELANRVFLELLAEQQSQSVVISGESGSGKTEATKQIMHFLTQTTATASSKELSNRLLQSNPVLEAFGNAKTLRNDNSSRFGKYVKIDLLLALNTKDAQLNGASIQDYLLEKSRVVHQANGERNYHIFYYMLCGLSEDERWSLHIEQDYRYLHTSVEALSQEEKQRAASAFKVVKDGLALVNVHGEVYEAVVKCLSAILLLGNITFTSSGQNDACGLASTAMPLVKSVADLLAVDGDELAETLVVRETQAENTVVASPLTVEEAQSGVDALAKSLYARLFSYVLAKVNDSLATKKQSGNEVSLGILDIFGFEVFEENGFEQLCINYANEKLQQLYTNYVFEVSTLTILTFKASNTTKDRRATL